MLDFIDTYFTDFPEPANSRAVHGNAARGVRKALRESTEKSLWIGYFIFYNESEEDQFSFEFVEESEAVAKEKYVAVLKDWIKSYPEPADVEFRLAAVNPESAEECMKIKGLTGDKLSTYEKYQLMLDLESSDSYDILSNLSYEWIENVIEHDELVDKAISNYMSDNGITGGKSAWLQTYDKLESDGELRAAIADQITWDIL